MSALVPFLTVDRPGAEVQSWISQQLLSAGLRVVQTFDLQVARLAHSDCPCPHHGTADCDCQLTVLLVYQEDAEPSSFVIHSRDGRAEISLGGPATRQADLNLEQLLERLILAGLPSSATAAETDHDAQSPA